MTSRANLSLAILLLALFLLLSACSFFKDFELFGSEPSAEAPEQKKILSSSTTVSPEVRELLEQARALWSASGECSDAEAATRLLDRAVRLDPLDPAPLILRSRALSELGYLDEAFEDITRAIQLSPTAEAYATRGLVCLKMNRPAGARRDFEYAEKLDAGEPMLYVYRASAAFLENRSKDACGDLEKACKLGVCAPWEKAAALCK